MQCGLRAVPPDAEGVLFTLVDHPAVAPAHHRRAAGAAAAGPLVRVPRYHGRRGHPIWFSRELIAEFLALPENGAARDVVRSHAARNRVPGRGRPRHPGRYRRPRGLPAASPEPPYEAPPRPAVQARRRGCCCCCWSPVFVAPVSQCRPVRRRLQASLERALGPPGRNRQGPLQPLQRPRLFGGQRHHPRRPLHRHGARRYIQEPDSMEVVPSLWSLLGGRFVIASIRLDGASINLTKSGPASEWGRWNFSSFVNRFGDEHRPRHPRARQPHPLQVRRHQDRSSTSPKPISISRRPAPAAIGGSTVRPSPRAPTVPRRAGLVHPQGPLVLPIRSASISTWNSTAPRWAK